MSSTSPIWARKPLPSHGAARRVWRFNVVGAIGIVVQFALLWILAKLLHVPTAFATAIAVAFTVAHNFAWHEHYTFADRVRHRAARTFRAIGARFLRFNLTTGAISVLGNVVFTTLLAQRARLPLLVANALAIAICAVLNYVASDRLVFRAAPKCAPGANQTH